MIQGLRSAAVPRRVRGTFVLLVLGIHTGLLADGVCSTFVTYNEVALIAAGISHWQIGTYSMSRGDPPLPRMLAVLPVILDGPNTESIQPDDTPGARPEWGAGVGFAAGNRDRYLVLLRLARMAGIMWSVAGGWLIYCWGRELYGDAAGLLGVTLWCFEPNVLGHAPLVTPDVPAAVACLAAMYAFRRWLRSPSWVRASLAGVIMGIAQLTEFSLLVLYLVFPVLWLPYRVTRVSALPLRIEIAHGVMMFVFSFLAINLGYEFDRTCQPLGSVPFLSIPLGGDPTKRNGDGNRFRDGMLADVPIPLPEDYLRGLEAKSLEFDGGKPSYLAGVWRYGGWWYYYIYALAVKVSLGTWGLLMMGLFLMVMKVRNREGWLEELTLWLPAIVILTLFSSATGLNNHMRFVLPVFPFVILSTSKVACLLRAATWKAGVLVIALLFWMIGSSLRVHPHYLSYFNELGGGPHHGHDHLLVSNIDWGQDLLFLKKWLDKHPEACPLGLAYHNIVPPQLVRITGFYLPAKGPDGKPPESEEAKKLGPFPGYYAVSVNFVRGHSSSTYDGEGHFHRAGLHDYEYFRNFQPIAKAGYSIFIYHISLEEANAVRRKLELPPVSEDHP